MIVEMQYSVPMTADYYAVGKTLVRWALGCYGNVRWALGVAMATSGGY